MLRKLFLIDGLAGSGKSDLMEFVKSSHARDATVIPKYSTRSRRQQEEAVHSDLMFVGEKKFEELNSTDFYSYQYAGKKYGFFKSTVLTALDNFEYVFIIVRSRDLVDRIRKEFANVAVVRPIFIHSDHGFIVDRLRKDGFDEETIEFRLERSKYSWDDYLAYPDSSLRIIINNSQKADFHRKINSLLEEFASEKIEAPQHFYVSPSLKFDLIAPLMGFKQHMYRHLKDFPFEKNVFVMMKFREENSAFFEHIKSEIERAGYNCVRADAPEWNITKNVYNPLAALYCCKYGIALFDEAEPRQTYNANVAYELGIMHYQGKQCLILKHDSLPEVPFDLVKDLRKVYSKEIDFHKLFSQWLIEVREES